MPSDEPVARFLGLPREELARQIALLYEQGLISLQERMHPGAGARAVKPGILIHDVGSAQALPGANETPEELERHGRMVMEAMMEPVRDRLCSDLRQEPSAFRDAGTAIPRITSHLTRVSPPDDLFVAAACLLWHGGLEEFCAKEEGK